MAYVWLNGEVVQESNAQVSALDRGLVWGHGLFETLRAYGGHPWALDRHHERLRAGADALRLSVPSIGSLAEAMSVVIEANGLSDCGVRLTLTAGPGPIDPHADPDGTPTEIVTAWPLRDYSALYARGASLITLAASGRVMPEIKTISYAVSIAGRLAARDAGADDALFLRPDGVVLETTGANLMALRDSELVTAAVAEGVLPGVTRGTVLEVAGTLGLRTREAGLTVTDLHESDEVLLTSSLREVYGVSSIDGEPVRTGPVAEQLRHAFHEHVLKSLL